LDEPLWHNKTVFTSRFLGVTKVNNLKRLCRELNRRLEVTAPDNAAV
jgi:hypothetical protein